MYDATITILCNIIFESIHSNLNNFPIKKNQLGRREYCK